ncbi:L-fucose dehydrogenase [Neolewinella xylanilytica]|uniref:L-fucose dehydrogenase n=1 Tax=Neolewinella xylanilytica TaxID=1514080 RepID=A0A2S6I3D2_9BACT|nr:SDR family oxidoreductase [Neolewinella xylanilytica]PPK85692.1 L-fucose dehydrogenase [Neolewinella xylanilytica]
METNLAGKVVVIAGAAGESGSIGEVMLRRIAAEGALPVILDRSDRGNTYAEALDRQGIDALFVRTDVTDPDQIEAAVEQIGEKYGRIDVLINNVGINDGVSLEGSMEAFLQSLRVNLVSYWCLTKYCLPHLKKSGGNVLNIGSKVALTGQGGTSGYAASKGGVLALTREWAVDFVPFNMRCNAIIIAECYTPAYRTWIDGLENGDAKLRSINEKIPLGQRMTTPEEIANTALFLISDLASHTTGQYVYVDGGYVHLDRALLPQVH